MRNTEIEFVCDDGGRAAAGFKGKAGDCAVRAITIATGLPYKQVYDGINALARHEPITKSRHRKSNARTGVWRDTVTAFLAPIGWRWVPTMVIGSGCRAHLRTADLPDGRIIVRVSRHYCAVINGVLHDTYDSSRNGMRCVYGYWVRDQ